VSRRLGSLLDRSLRRSISAIGLAISAAEAQVNEWAVGEGGWTENEDRETLVKKMKTLAAKTGKNLDIGRSPFQNLHRQVRFRHDLIHPKALPQEVELGGTEAPGRGPSVEARQTCFFVRESLIYVARTIGVDAPRYLAYCPPSGYEDDDVWWNASGMTGARDDPDFPNLAG